MSLHTVRENSHNLIVNAKSRKLDSTKQDNFALPNDEKILQEVREFIYSPATTLDYSAFGGQTIICLFHTDSTRALMQELETQEKQTAMPTKAEYKEAEAFLDRQMDRLMLEIAKENYNLLPLATKFAKMGEQLSEKEENLVAQGDLVAFLRIMNAYSEKDFRVGLSGNNGEYNQCNHLDYKSAEKLAINGDSLKQDKNGVVFFSHIADRLSSEQRKEIIEAIAKVRVYEEANGFQVANVFLKRNTTTGDYDFSLVNSAINSQTESLILRYSNLAYQSVLDILENKEHQATESQSSTSDSIMQTLLKDSKKGNSFN